MPQDDSKPVFFPFRDFIPRYQTASAQLIQGVRKGEDPLLTIAWTIPGSTLTTVAIPLWITAKNELFRRASDVITVLRRNGRAGRETTEFYQWVDQYVREQYQQRFGVIL